MYVRDTCVHVRTTQPVVVDRDLLRFSLCLFDTILHFLLSQTRCSFLILSSLLLSYVHLASFRKKSREAQSLFLH